MREEALSSQGPTPVREGTKPVKAEKKVVQREKSGDGKGGDGERQRLQSILRALIWTSSWEGTEGL